MSRNGDLKRALGGPFLQPNMTFSLPNNNPAISAKSLNNLIKDWEPYSHQNLDCLTLLGKLRIIFNRLKVQSDRVLNILKRLIASLALANAARQTRNGRGEAAFFTWFK